MPTCSLLTTIPSNSWDRVTNSFSEAMQKIQSICIGDDEYVLSNKSNRLEPVKPSVPKPSNLMGVKLERVIFNDPATIVFWSDGTKTVVKANNEPFDKEKGLAMAIIKKIYGNKGNFNNIFRKYCAD